MCVVIDDHVNGITRLKDLLRQACTVSSVMTAAVAAIHLAGWYASKTK